MASAAGRVEIMPSGLDGGIESADNDNWVRLALLNPQLAALIKGEMLTMNPGEVAGSFINGYIPYPSQPTDISACCGIYPWERRYIIRPLIFAEPAKAANGALVFKVFEIIVGDDGVIPQRKRTLLEVVDLFFRGQHHLMRENELAKKKKAGGYTYCYYYIVTRSGDAKVITISCALLPP